MLPTNTESELLPFLNKRYIYDKAFSLFLMRKLLVQRFAYFLMLYKIP